MVNTSSLLAIAAVACFATVRPAQAQGDFQQRRPGPVDAGARPTPTLTRPPRVITGPNPTYPPAALAAGLIADVTMQVDLDAAGQVTNVKVTGPARADGGVATEFDDAAMAAVRAMQWGAAEIDNVPAPIRFEYTLRFRPPRLVPVGDGGGSDGGVSDGGAASDALTSQVGDTAPAPDLAPRAPAIFPLGRGVLRERGTRDPLESADVRVIRAPDPSTPGAEPAELTSTTDGEGRFVVEGAPGERVRVVIATGQHEPCIREFVLPAADATPVELTCLVKRLAINYETVVEAPRKGEEVTRHSLSQPELTSVPGTFGDPLRAIQNLPGISRAPYGLGLLLVRGASPQDSGVYIDGHKVPLLYHFAVGPSILTPDLIERIDFYPGGFGVRYGRASAGVIDVATRTDPVKRFHGAADVDFLDAGAYLEGPIGGGYSMAAGARRSYIDTLLPLVLPEGETVAAPVYWDYQARISRSISPSERISVFAFGSRDSLEVLSSDPDSGSLDLGTSVMLHRVIGTWTKAWDGWTSRLSPSYGFDSVGFRAGTVDADGSAHVFGLREEVTKSFGDSFSIVAGLDNELRFDRVAFNVPLPPERRTFGRTRRTITDISRKLSNLGVAGYAEVLWDVVPRLRVVPGIRFDWFHYSATDKISVDPRLVTRLELAEGTFMKGGLGLFHQPPTPQQLDPQFGTPTLPLITAQQFHYGVEHAFSPAIAIDGTVYYMRKLDLPRTSGRRAADGGVERYAPDGRGRGYGFEVLLKHRPTGNFFGWVAYSISRTEERRRNTRGDGPPATPYRPTLFDQTHNLTALASRTVGDWEFGARFRLVSGLPQTPILGGEYDADQNDWDPVQGEPGSVRRQTFHQLDLRVEKNFIFEAWRFAVYLDVQNVYNAENPEANVNDYRFRQTAPVRGLPILPILGMRGRF